MLYAKKILARLHVLCSRIFKIPATNLSLQMALAIIFSQYLQIGVLAWNSVTIFALVCPKVELSYRYGVPSMYSLLNRK